MSENLTEKERQLCRLEGAFEVLDALREELEQWVDEAQDQSKREALENVVGHVATMEEEYARRRRELGGSS